MRVVVVTYHSIDRYLALVDSARLHSCITRCMLLSPPAGPIHHFSLSSQEAAAGARLSPATRVSPSLGTRIEDNNLLNFVLKHYILPITECQRREQVNSTRTE